MKNRTLAVMTVSLLAGLGACKNLPVKDGYYACEPGVSGNCPPGMTCEWSAEDGEYRCVRPSDSDAGSPDGDIDAAEPGCGNDIQEQGEQCDGSDMGGETCETLGYSAGVLACMATCHFDPSDCGPPPTCGNGAVEPPESCDGNDLDGKTCEALGYSGGTLGCTLRCTFSVSGCFPPATCGDGFVEPPEECDGINLDGNTCASRGFAGGTLVCRPNCTFDTSGCVNCIDADGDGHDMFHTTLCPSGDDHCDSDPYNWTPTGCTSCVDNDGDGRGEDCDIGTDCDDNNPAVWTGCPGCNDTDGDGHDAYHPVDCPTGDDSCDNDPHNWTPTGCTSCVDNDGDGRGNNCDLGDDCNDNNPAIWTGCANCGDGLCDPTESVSGCPADCFCGNGSCDQGETTGSCPADCPTNCIDPVCDFWPQCGCGAGVKCTLMSNGDRGCGPSGVTAHGALCNGDGECMPGTLCAAGGTNPHTCQQFCVDHSDCPVGPGSRCEYQITYGGNPIPGATLCSMHCDPMDPSIHCLTGWNCYLYMNSSNETYTDCSIQAGSSTTSCNWTDTFCAPGWVCDNGQCLQYCRIGQNDCPGGMSCLNYVPPAIVGTIEYGFCN